MSTATVVDPLQVALNGTVYGPGETVEVPDDLAASWLQHGWVTEEKTPAKKAAPKKGAR